MADWSEAYGRLHAEGVEPGGAAVVVGPGGEVLYANTAFARDSGYGSGEETSREMNLLQRVHPDDRSRLAGLLSTGQEVGEVGYRFRCADGSWRWVEVRATPLVGSRGEEGTLLRAREPGGTDERERSNARFREVLDLVPDAVLVHDERGRLIDCNREACRSLGYAREELLTLSVRDFAVGLISEEERRAAGGDTLWLRAVASEPGETVGYHGGLHRRKDGSIFPVEVAVGAVEYGGRRRILAVCRDVTESRRLEKEIEHGSLHDPLTGLANRLLFSEQLERALHRARAEATPVSLLALGLDDLRRVNDLFGHAAGDLVLVDFARRLRVGLRPGTVICRLGGGEFAAILERCGREEAAETARKLLRALEDPLRLDASGRQIFVTAGVGISSTEDPELAEASGEALLRAASSALSRHRAEDAGTSRDA